MVCSIVYLNKKRRQFEENCKLTRNRIFSSHIIFKKKEFFQKSIYLWKNNTYIYICMCAYEYIHVLV